MMKPREDITEAELSVMEVLWDRGEGATVRQIVLAVYGRHEHSLHGGVKSFLDRLIEKRYVRVDKTGFAHQFFAVVTREEFVGLQLKQIAASHFNGSLVPMLVSLVGQSKLSKADRAAIEKLIANIRE
jgi:BlaI family transcriptional regulator, penicillinase repressor